MRKSLLSLISSKNYAPMKASDIAYILGIPKAFRKEMLFSLEKLQTDGKIAKDPQGNYSIVRSEAGTGREDFQGRSSGHHTARGSRNVHPQSSGKTLPIKLSADEKRRILKRPGGDLTEVLAEYGIPMKFPAAVLAQSEKIPDSPGEDDAAGRLDLRNKTVFTVDGDDSRDFDDAVSLEKDGDDYILGVHIADVSHYVPEGSALDREALKRGTSVYIPDRVVPMLPEKLSNGICSLNEGEDRLTLSCIVRIDRDGNIKRSGIFESVICSCHRMTYSSVDRIFEHDQELMSKYADIVPVLCQMKELSEILAAVRKSRGMIDFDIPETKFELDGNGRPLKVYAVHPTSATKMIEQFMLTANEVVAETYARKKIPFMYRVHEHPDPDRTEEVLTAVRALGYRAVKSGRSITPREVQNIIKEVSGKPDEAMISSMVLRSMARAKYSTVNIGHFGLAAKYYCHFTSPIRRYPDLQIHRIIKDDIAGRLTERKAGHYGKILDDAAWKSSALERRASDAEREASRVKMAEYVIDHPGEISGAVITGVTGWGIYVRRPDTIEGLVHISSISGDYYEFDEKHMQLKGKHRGRIFRTGQHVMVKFYSADVRRRIIDFRLAEEDDAG